MTIELRSENFGLRSALGSLSAIMAGNRIDKERDRQEDRERNRFIAETVLDVGKFIATEKFRGRRMRDEQAFRSDERRAGEGFRTDERLAGQVFKAGESVLGRAFKDETAGADDAFTIAEREARHVERLAEIEARRRLREGRDRALRDEFKMGWDPNDLEQVRILQNAYSDMKDGLQVDPGSSFDEAQTEVALNRINDQLDSYQQKLIPLTPEEKFERSQRPPAERFKDTTFTGEDGVSYREVVRNGVSQWDVLHDPSKAAIDALKVVTPYFAESTWEEAQTASLAYLERATAAQSGGGRQTPTGQPTPTVPTTKSGKPSLRSLAPVFPITMAEKNDAHKNAVVGQMYSDVRPDGAIEALMWVGDKFAVIISDDDYLVALKLAEEWEDKLGKSGDDKKKKKGGATNAALDAVRGAS